MALLTELFAPPPELTEEGPRLSVDYLLPLEERTEGEDEGSLDDGGHLG